MKNILRTKIDLFGTPVIVCFGAKAFKKVIKKEHGIKDGTELLDSLGKYVSSTHGLSVNIGNWDRGYTKHA